MSNEKNVVYISEPNNIPPHLNKERYIEGYLHGWQSNTLTDLRKSFAEGFRRAKMEVREYWKQQGVVPMDQGKYNFKIKTE